jgi:hypothetical protein
LGLALATPQADVMLS